MKFLRRLPSFNGYLTSGVRHRVIQVIVFLLIFLFVYAAFMKLLAIDQFRVQIGQSPLLTRWADTLSWAVPCAELVISLHLCFRSTRTLGLFASFGLMFMFTTYIIVVMNFSPYVPCSCGGVLEDMTWGQHLVFNVAFIVLALVGILLSPIQHEVSLLE